MKAIRTIGSGQAHQFFNFSKFRHSIGFLLSVLHLATCSPPAVAVVVFVASRSRGGCRRPSLAHASPRPSAAGPATTTHAAERSQAMRRRRQPSRSLADLPQSVGALPSDLDASTARVGPVLVLHGGSDMHLGSGRRIEPDPTITGRVVGCRCRFYS